MFWVRYNHRANGQKFGIRVRMSHQTVKVWARTSSTREKGETTKYFLVEEIHKMELMYCDLYTACTDTIYYKSIVLLLLRLLWLVSMVFAVRPIPTPCETTCPVTGLPPKLTYNNCILP